jgi:glycosyltransferase involved in cell wall biosynthesis
LNNDLGVTPEGKKLGDNFMRTCMLAYTYYEYDNRVMRYAETLAKRGHHVDVMALGKAQPPGGELLRGVHVYHLQHRILNEKNKFSYLWRIIKFFFKAGWFLTRRHLKQPYELIHCHSVPDFLVFAAIVPKLLGAKIILDIHDILPEFYASKFSRGGKGIVFRLLRLVETVSTGFAHHVIISNHIWKERLEARSVRPEKCTAILNYPDHNIFFPRKQNKKNNHFMMIYHGTMAWHQGLDLAVKALDRIKAQAPQAVFMVYGNGPEWGDLSDLIARLGLHDRVHLRRGKPLPEIAEIIAGADLGVIPKRNDQFGGEAFSTKTLEFMISGVPIILARTKIDQFYFNDSVVKFFEPGNVDDLADAMLSMITDKDSREKKAARGVEFAYQNCWNQNEHLYLDILKHIGCPP